MTQLRVLDLFAGCGGLSQGLSDAGYQIVAAYERDKWAADTYSVSHPDVPLFQRDISEVTDEEWFAYRDKVDLVAGGPPCQGFSISGKRQYGIHSDLNSLVEVFVHVVRMVQPRAVLIENVEGFRTANIRPGLGARSFARQALIDMNYHVYDTILQAVDFGIPSLRKRYFLVASKEQLSCSPFPTAVHGRGLRPYVTVSEAISDLPQILAGEGIDGPQAYGNSPQSKYQTIMRIGSEHVYNHVGMKHGPKVVERFKRIEPGGSSFRFFDQGDPQQKVTVYKSNNQRLFADKPGLCITANFQSNYIHPSLHRNLTAREAARLMTFPDRYLFKGKRTQMSSSLLRKEGREHENYLSQYNQIGNAVPPLLAKCIGQSLHRALNGTLQQGQLHMKWA